MYNGLGYNFTWANQVSYFSSNTNESFQKDLSSLNQKYGVGNFFVVERVTQWTDLTYSEDVPTKWSAMFIAQIVEYSPAQGTMNIFTGKKRITKLPRLVVKAPDGTRFEPLVFKDTGEYIKAEATDLTVKYLLENTCVGAVPHEDFGLYSGRVWMRALSRNDAMQRFSCYNLQKEESAANMRSEYIANKRKREMENEARKQQAEEQRKREVIASQSREMFDSFFGSK